MPRTAVFTDFMPVRYHVLKKKYSQRAPDFHNQRFSLGEELGSGAYGVAFQFNDTHTHDGTFVAKLPATLMTKKRAAPDEHLNIGQVLQPHPSPVRLANAQRLFDAECRNAELILDAPVIHRPGRRPGEGYAKLTDEQRRKFVLKNDEWRRQPGYEHLHRLLHYDHSIPMLISRRCDGTLAQLRYQWHTAFGPISAGAHTDDADPALWRDLLGRQLGAAVGFILRHTPIAHVDIKPDNLLYTQLAAGVYRLQLSDYGVCYPKDDPAESFKDEDHKDVFCGTVTYTPPVNAPGWGPQPQGALPTPTTSMDAAGAFNGLLTQGRESATPSLGSHSSVHGFLGNRARLHSSVPYTAEQPEWLIDDPESHMFDNLESHMFDNVSHPGSDIQPLHEDSLRSEGLLPQSPVPATAPVFQPPSNRALSLFQYFATVIGCLVVPNGGRRVEFVDCIGNSDHTVYDHAHIDGGLLQTRLDRVHQGRGNSLFIHAMRGLLSENPEMELLWLFQQLHFDLAIECDCP